MIELPSLDLAQLVRLTREGGLAYLPGLAQPRHIDMTACPPGVRQEVCEALLHAAPKAVSCGPDARGDQRYFHVEVEFEGADAPRITFDVPEADAPPALVQLWKRQAGQSG